MAADAYLIALVATTLLSNAASARLERKGLLLLSTLVLSLTSTLGSVAGDLTDPAVLRDGRV